MLPLGVFFVVIIIVFVFFFNSLVSLIGIQVIHRYILKANSIRQSMIYKAPGGKLCLDSE